ncbi:acyl-CoA synthetase [Blastococcus sp. CCUG 61487]|uniref:acyl-CoA synthetase n=1 Tax=Blastococcus sp. CCUG 61487 TaxID=1840703 RepID=UPI0010C0B66A|nr:acyl-CoA synthetase [Blastococcus sp. CCUG 61487]TKJ25739.1 acyl-CoA synthetase [Blastococcus sp. CCUG 61487]
MYPGTWAQQTPDKTAIVMAGSGRSLTYKELDDNSRRTAHFLRDTLGLKTGDSIVVLSDNVPETLELYWSGVRIGLYVTFANSHLAAPEADYIIENSGARALFVSAGLSDLASKLQANGVERRLMFGGTIEGYESYEEVRDAASDEPLVDQPRGDTMLYSSGTTGRPKGIKRPLTGQQVTEMSNMSAVLQLLYGMTEDTVYLSPAPAYHAAPMAFMAAVQSLGGTVVMMEKFDPEGVLEAIQRFGVTETQMVPTHFVRMLKLPEDVRNGYDLSSLKMVIHAAAPCPPDVKRAMIDWLGPIIMEYYSSTEAAGSTFIDSATWLEHPGSVGKPTTEGALHICGPDGTELGPGEVGIVYFASPTGERPFSYHGDEEKSLSAQHPEHPGWTTVGDLGYVDEDGFLYLTDRSTFMIISGGVNIYPQEIENVFTLHPKVSDIGVIGVPDPEMGERVVAFVEPAEGVEGTPELAAELAAFAREQLSGFKVPREFHFRDTLPRTPTGKMVKGKLRDEYATSVS